MMKQVASFSFALSITLVACVGEIAETDRPCPCAEGWNCCYAANVCVAPGISCPPSNPPKKTMTSAEGTPDAAGLDGMLSDVSAIPDVNAIPFVGLDASPTDDPAGSCPTIAGFNGSFTPIADMASMLAGVWWECTGNISIYGGPQTTLASLGAPADTLGIEFAAATVGGGSCKAATANGMPCEGGSAYYLVAGPTGLVRGQGNAYEISYAVDERVTNGDPPANELLFGETATTFAYGPPGPPASAYALTVGTPAFSSVALIKVPATENDGSGLNFN